MRKLKYGAERNVVNSECGYINLLALHYKIPQGSSYMVVAQSCPTLCDPMECSLPGSSARGIFQARILEWVSISFSRGSSQPRDWAQVFCFEADSLLSEPQGKLKPVELPHILEPERLRWRRGVHPLGSFWAPVLLASYKDISQTWVGPPPQAPPFYLHYFFKSPLSKCSGILGYGD